jgi:putative transposase
VDKTGDTIDSLFGKRSRAAARRVFQRAMARDGTPETLTIDESGSNLAALHAIDAKREAPIKVRQFKYSNNIVGQDHRAFKRVTRPTLGFKHFDCARVILSGIEVLHMVKKGQMKGSDDIALSAAQQLYPLIA